MIFTDRGEASRLLAKKLSSYKGGEVIILALPRGGVVLGYEIAQELGAPLDIIAVRKVGHPGNPEYAVCAVDEKGMLLCDEVSRASINPEWLAEEIQREQAEARRRSDTYRQGRQPLSIAGKTVIIVDDGIATGLTMRLAIRSVRAQQPESIIVAVPVAPEDVVSEIVAEADELVLLVPPEEYLGAVGAHYAHFPQLGDSEVMRLLA